MSSIALVQAAEFTLSEQGLAALDVMTDNEPAGLSVTKSRVTGGVEYVITFPNNGGFIQRNWSWALNGNKIQAGIPIQTGDKLSLKYTLVSSSSPSSVVQAGPALGVQGGYNVGALSLGGANGTTGVSTVASPGSGATAYVGSLIYLIPNNTATWPANGGQVRIRVSPVPGLPVLGAGLRGDFNRDTQPDLIFQDQLSGWAQIWYLGGTDGSTITNAANLTLQNPWRIVGVADFNEDGKSDLVWQDPQTGAVQIWYLTGAQGNQILDAANIVLSNSWRVVATADFNQDGHPDIIWQDPATGASQMWLLGGTRGLDVIGSAPLSGSNPWRIAAAGDFNRDGRTDVIWQDQGSGFAQIWFLGGAQGATLAGSVNLVQTNPWRIAATGDLDRDGHIDLVWQDPATGASQAWYMGGTQGNEIVSAVPVGAPNTWRISGPR